MTYKVNEMYQDLLVEYTDLFCFLMVKYSVAEHTAARKKMQIEIIMNQTGTHEMCPK